MIYVDIMRNCLRKRNWPYDESCHMIADSIDELNEFADKLGLKRTWFQPLPTPHYDLTRWKRKRALALGAIPLERNAFMAIVKERRQQIDRIFLTKFFKVRK